MTSAQDYVLEELTTVKDQMHKALEELWKAKQLMENLSVKTHMTRSERAVFRACDRTMGAGWTDMRAAYLEMALTLGYRSDNKLFQTIDAQIAEWEKPDEEAEEVSHPVARVTKEDLVRRRSEILAWVASENVQRARNIEEHAKMVRSPSLDFYEDMVNTQEQLVEEDEEEDYDIVEEAEFYCSDSMEE